MVDPMNATEGLDDLDERRSQASTRIDELERECSHAEEVVRATSALLPAGGENPQALRVRPGTARHGRLAEQVSA